MVDPLVLKAGWRVEVDRSPREVDEPAGARAGGRSSRRGLISVAPPAETGCGTRSLWYSAQGAFRCQGDDVAKKAKKSTRKPSAAFMKPMTPSAALGTVVGTKPLPRTEVTKKLWAYIKKNKLQDPKAKRNIKADENLKAVFGGKAVVDMFEMTKLVNRHLK
jgi:upstream activation factor subunit UAF30